jgi:phosphoglucomutase
VLGKKPATFLIGRDPRPTGAAIADAMAHGFLAGAAASGCKLVIMDLGVITTPLAEAAVRALSADGGVMITASHNPIDHNGFKFLTGSSGDRSKSAPVGALLSAHAMAKVMADVQGIADGSDGDFEKYARSISPETIKKEMLNPHRERARVLTERAYLDAMGTDWGVEPHCLKPLVLGPVMLDPNGGAGCGIGARVLEHFGVRVIEINAEVGYPEHAIDTDGIDSASGRHMLLRAARAASRHQAHFGVAFDYDADRGNLVLPGIDEAAIIPPQRVAVFNIAMAIARRKILGGTGPLAVVLSDATSLASHRVAAAFGARIFQVETGEINVVSKMYDLREEGYDVPVGVEGANGGTVFGSATCRDGLQVALSAAQAESIPEVVDEWMRIGRLMNGGRLSEPHPASLRSLVDSMPFNSNHMLKLSSPPMPHGELKRGLEEHFHSVMWPALASRFQRYEFQNFEETRMVEARTGDESGAWRVVMEAPGRSAFVFVRGSRTESGVWRMIVDTDSPEDFAPVNAAANEMFSAATR